MSKITKQDLQFQINRLYAADSIRHNKMLRMQRALSSLGVDIMSDDFDKPSDPKLKDLDQSVFDELDEEYCFAAIDAMGRLMCSKTQMMRDKNHWIANAETSGLIIVGVGYDTTDWKNSLIERESELTGSDLAKDYFNRGGCPRICFVGEDNDESLSDLVVAMVIGYDENTGFETSYHNFFPYAMLVNAYGEKLPASRFKK